MSRGDGRVFKRGPRNWWVAYCVDGKEHRERARDKGGRPVRTETEAENFLKARIKQKHASEISCLPFIGPQANRVRVHELLEALKADYKLRGKDSVQNLNHLKRAEEDFGEYRAVGLKAEEIDAYIEERLAEGNAASTINHTLQCLSQGFKLAVRRRTLGYAPYIRKLSEKGNERQGFLAPAAFKKLLAALPNDGIRDFAQWCYATGQRKSEGSALTWSMVDGEIITIPAEISKNRTGRVLPLTGELATVLKRRKAARMVDGTLSEYIFHRGDGRRILEFRKTWRTALRKANLPGILFHDLRRSAVRNLVQAGVAPQVAKKISGHQSDSMFHRYNIIIPGDMSQALAKAEKYRKIEEAKKPKVVSLRPGA